MHKDTHRTRPMTHLYSEGWDRIFVSGNNVPVVSGNARQSTVAEQVLAGLEDALAHAKGDPTCCIANKPPTLSGGGPKP